MILSRCNRPSLEELDDPLLYYEQNIAHLQQNNYLQDAFKQLENAVLQYKDDVRYKNSPRYLRLWLTYIFYLKSSFIFPILFGLIDNRIGDKLATLYEAIAYQQLKEKRLVHHDKQTRKQLTVRSTVD
jgi:hypothetical protein